MISFEEMIDATSDPKIASLDTSAFSHSDVVNIILQRSEIIRDQRRPGRIVNDWAEGDDKPALALVERMGDTLVRRAAAVIWREYIELKPTIDLLAPKSVADIGCGYAIFDLFLWQDAQCPILLIDLETTSERHFGYKPTGAAYSNLEVARRFLVANGVSEQSITLRNPLSFKFTPETQVDLAVSFISCGFHYPVETYLDFFQNNVASEGGVILDFRARKAREGIKTLKNLGDVSTLTDAANGNAKRVFLQKRLL